MKYTDSVSDNVCVCLQNLRALENSLEKTQFKCKEAENILTNYLKLKSHLQVWPIDIKSYFIFIFICRKLYLNDFMLKFSIYYRIKNVVVQVIFPFSLALLVFMSFSLCVPNFFHSHPFRRRAWLSMANWTVWKQKSWSTERNFTTCRSWTMTPSSLKKLLRWAATSSAGFTAYMWIVKASDRWFTIYSCHHCWYKVTN